MGIALRSGCAFVLFAMRSGLQKNGDHVFLLHAFIIRSSWGGEARSRGCALPNYTREVVCTFLQMFMKDHAHPPINIQESSSKLGSGVFGSHFSQERPSSTSPQTILHN